MHARSALHPSTHLLCKQLFWPPSYRCSVLLCGLKLVDGVLSWLVWGGPHQTRVPYLLLTFVANKTFKGATSKRIERLHTEI